MSRLIVLADENSQQNSVFWHLHRFPKETLISVTRLTITRDQEHDGLSICAA